MTSISSGSTGKKGQRILVDAQCARIGSGIDPSIRLTAAGASRTYVASADDSPGLVTDARLTAVLPADGDYVVELSDSRYQGGGRPVYRLVIGAVPEAEEVFPLGGRQGETVGLELRGGMLTGMRIAAATLNPLVRNRIMPARITSAALGIAAPAQRGSRPGIAAAAGRLAVSRAARAGRSGRRAARAIAPVVFNGRIDPPGENDRFVIATTPGPADADQGRSLGVRFGARRRASGTGKERLGDRQCRRYEHPAARAQRPASRSRSSSPDPSLETDRSRRHERDHRW